MYIDKEILYYYVLNDIILRQQTCCTTVFFDCRHYMYSCYLDIIGSIKTNLLKGVAFLLKS